LQVVRWERRRCTALFIYWYQKNKYSELDQMKLPQNELKLFLESSASVIRELRDEEFKPWILPACKLLHISRISSVFQSSKQQSKYMWQWCVIKQTNRPILDIVHSAVFLLRNITFRKLFLFPSSSKRNLRSILIWSIRYNQADHSGRAF
jgi:hypothetical protein